MSCSRLSRLPVMALLLTASAFPTHSPFPFRTLLNANVNVDVNVDVNSANDLSMDLQRKKSKQERLQRASHGLHIHVLGLSIHHAQVHVRERLAIPESEWNAFSRTLTSLSPHIVEAAVLSTCNRFEIYYTSTHSHTANTHILLHLAANSQLPMATLRTNIFLLQGEDAVSHLLRVAAGLDSLVVGEGQILSQVRQCHLHSIATDGCGGKVLSRLLNNAVAAGKRVRSETNISKGSVSISSAAVELTEANCQRDVSLPFSEARLAVVGAGTMTRLLVTHLASRGLERITIVNRSRGRVEDLQTQFPQVDIELALMDDLGDVMRKNDVVYFATSSTDYVVDEEWLIQHGWGKGEGRPIMLVDIAVPRNVGPQCGTVSGVTAYNVDDLKAVVAKNTSMRQREVLEAESLLRAEVASFLSWQDSLSAIPTIHQLQERANMFRQEELKKCTRKLSQNDNFTEKELEAVERLSRGIVNKMLHGPMAHLRRAESVNGKQAAVKELSSMFRLEEEERGKVRGRRR